MAEAGLTIGPWSSLIHTRVTQPILRTPHNSDIYAVLLIDPAAIPAFGTDKTQWRCSTGTDIRIINPVMKSSLSPGGQRVPRYAEVELAGLAGDFAPYNGTKMLLNSFANYSNWIDITGKLQLLSFSRPVVGWGWEVHLDLQSNCRKYWHRSWVVSDPEGTYAEYSCSDSNCVDGNSCENSAGATCRVRWAGATWP